MDSGSEDFSLALPSSDAALSSASGSSCGLPKAKRTKRAYSMKESKRGASFVHCIICSTDFSVASGGVHEIKRHRR